MAGEEIRQRRQALGLSLRDVGAHAGVAFITVLRVEQGGPVAPTTKARVAKTLDILERNRARLERELAAVRVGA